MDGFPLPSSITSDTRNGVSLDFTFRMHGIQWIYNQQTSAWWYTYPSEKYEIFGWDDYSQYTEK